MRLDPPLAPDENLTDICRCGHLRQDHLHARQHCLRADRANAGHCGCESFTPAGQPIRWVEPEPEEDRIEGGAKNVEQFT